MTTSKQPNQQNSAEQTKGGNLPMFHVYSIRDRGRKEKAIFCKIGAAWPTQDGTGFSIQLDALPISDRIVLFEPSEKKDEAEIQG